MLPGVEPRGSPSPYLEPGDFFAHLQSFPQLHLPPLSHPHVFSPQALQLMSLFLPVKDTGASAPCKPTARAPTEIRPEEIAKVPVPASWRKSCAPDLSPRNRFRRGWLSR